MILWNWESIVITGVSTHNPLIHSDGIFYLERRWLCLFDFTLSSALTEISEFHLNTQIMENGVDLWKYSWEDYTSRQIWLNYFQCSQYRPMNKNKPLGKEKRKWAQERKGRETWKDSNLSVLCSLLTSQATALCLSLLIIKFL